MTKHSIRRYAAIVYAFMRCLAPHERCLAPHGQWWRLAMVVVFALCCGKWALAQALVGGRAAQAVKATLVGEWVADVGNAKLRLHFGSHGEVTLDGASGQYSVDGSNLTVRLDAGSSSYQFELAGDQLTLSGGDLARPLKFVRLPEMGGYLGWVSGFSVRSSWVKLYRILTIALIVVAARVLFALLRGLSHFMVVSDWGPLRFVYRTRKNRTLTIHSLVLNLCKYAVYIVALGMILTELGVNYTTYLASLSVLGLAIAFGSQGFIQDMVTGFFVIFEEQYDVGDMVEISGQIGIVEELGLRMTRLRNYLGQVVTIPNRNIAVVGNYAKGALIAWVDVALANPDAAAQAAPVVEQTAMEIARQFSGVVLAQPSLVGPLSLDTGEHFVRVQLAIWPAQQWIIDLQLVPRIREVLKARGFEIPNDRVVVYYHQRKEIDAPTLGKRLAAARSLLWSAGGGSAQAADSQGEPQEVGPPQAPSAHKPSATPDPATHPGGQDKSGGKHPRKGHGKTHRRRR